MLKKMIRFFSTFFLASVFSRFFYLFPSYFTRVVFVPVCLRTRTQRGLQPIACFDTLVEEAPDPFANVHTVQVVS